jgi:RNA-directed DNA polymerase
MLGNLSLNEVDRMLERAAEVTRRGRFRYVEYARFADDLVVLVDAHESQPRLYRQVRQRLREVFARLGVEINEEKSRSVDLRKGENIGFLGFDFRRIRA